MDKYEEIEEVIAARYGKTTTTRKAIGDFMLDDEHAVNIKSNNVEKQNYSPNMISIKKMHEWVFEDNKKLSFIFVDYKIGRDGVEIINETKPILIEHLSWSCLTIEAQGYGVIQMPRSRVIDENQSLDDFYHGFICEYKRYMVKEKNKHEKFQSKLRCYN